MLVLTVIWLPLRQIRTCLLKRNWGSAIVDSCVLVAGGISTAELVR